MNAKRAEAEALFLRSEEEKKELLIECFTEHMLDEITFDGNVGGIISELYDLGFPGKNKRSLRKLHDYHYADTPRQQILTDMMLEVRESLFEKPILFERYLSYFSERYKEDVARTQIVIEVAKKEPDRIKFILSKENIDWSDWFEGYGKYSKTGGKKNDYWFIFLYQVYNLEYQFCYRRPDLLHFREKRKEKKQAAFIFENKFFSQVRERIDWCSDLRNSHQFEVFYKRVIETIEKSLRKADICESLAKEYKKKYYDIYRGMTYHLLKEKNLAGSWIFVTDNKKNQYYMPDIDDIIKTYVYYKLCNYWKTRIEKDDVYTISKLDITRCHEDVFPPSNAESFLSDIKAFIEEDFIANAYNELLITYYEDWSIDKQSQDSVIEQYSNLLNNTQEKLNSCREEIAGLRKDNEKLNKRLFSEIKNEEILSDIREKDKEIEYLKQRIENLNSQLYASNEMIIQLQKEDKADIKTSEIDYDFLRQKKFLFVGYIDGNISEIRKVFPNSAFMTENTYDIHGIQVDAIICIVRFMSHSMLYKIKSSKELMDCPIVYYSGTNIDGLCAKISGSLEK